MMFSQSNQPKDLWQKLKKLNVTPEPDRSCSYPPAEELNNHYVSVPITDENAIQDAIESYRDVPPKVNEKFHFKHVLLEDLLKAMSTLKSNAKGTDGITAVMLKHCLIEISPAVLHIFNFSLQYGVYPDLWKIASVTPIPKMAGACDAKNFRPISILCTLSKLLEKIVHAQLVSYLISHNLFDPLQSGFRSGHSTTTALLKVIGDVRESAGRRKLSLLILFDFSNAFPSVHHELLLTKLQNLGLSDSSLAWMHSYLVNRQQFVNTGESISTLAQVLLGVPQGSVLGPLLYVLYVHDISSIFTKSRYHLYADDLQNYLEFYPEQWQEAIATANLEASKLVEYAKRHNLVLNNGTPILYSDTVKNLGVIIDKHLSWEPHAVQICKKGTVTFQPSTNASTG
ncbi:hypothetical protein ONE63_005049 [Megalurothrips usitatus]|uniref:Reverse transcriptase domain-containing protein n=1 Tax=Megalurothrips usitatus TaxID=439358 RepID=A0AAV7X5M6_9NEOP|nr:hypothetical protein ONE63_005049 [Megalurothrips usitatus]